jgi:hypothetical protein
MIKQVIDSPSLVGTIQQITEKPTKYGPSFYWEFKNEKGEKYLGFTETSLKLGNRLWTWLYCLGYEVKTGENFDLDTLQGTKCKIYLGGKSNAVSAIIRSDIPASRPQPSSTQTVQKVAPAPVQDIPPVVSTGDEIENLFS